MNVLPAISATNGHISTQSARSYSRVKNVFVTFGTAEFDNINDSDKAAARRETNGFTWPSRVDKSAGAAYRAYQPDRDNLEFQCTSEAKRCPSIRFAA